jgi:hypothetical protein
MAIVKFWYMSGVCIREVVAVGGRVEYMISGRYVSKRTDERCGSWEPGTPYLGTEELKIGKLVSHYKP